MECLGASSASRRSFARHPSARTPRAPCSSGSWVSSAAFSAWSRFVVLSFYFLIETDVIFRTFIRLFPRRQRPHVRDIAQQITEKVSAWLSGQVMVAGIIGATAAVALGLMGVPYFYVLALVAAVGELIPYLGPLPRRFRDRHREHRLVEAHSRRPSSSWRSSSSRTISWLPRLMSNQVGLSSVAVIIALLVGASLFGIIGAILAVPPRPIVQVLFYELVRRPRTDGTWRDMTGMADTRLAAPRGGAHRHLRRRPQCCVITHASRLAFLVDATRTSRRSRRGGAGEGVDLRRRLDIQARGAPPAGTDAEGWPSTLREFLNAALAARPN